MLYTPITSFRRPMDAVQIKHQEYATKSQPENGVNKWSVLKDVTTARKHYGLSDRAIAVLQTLLSFHRETILSGSDLVVFPSNASICERLGGMACSTMRRHLAALIETGLILRRDSPNGKRYVKRYSIDAQAFGFDLAPLVSRSLEIAKNAQHAKDAEEAFQKLRQAVSLMKRDLIGLEGYARQTAPDDPKWDAFGDLIVLTSRALRRVLSYAQLDAIGQQLHAAIMALKDALATDQMSTKPAQNEQHIQRSKKESFDKDKMDKSPAEASVPLHLVLDHCREFQCFIDGPVHNDEGLIRAAETIRPMIGISDVVWFEAISDLGKRTAGIVVLAMLEKFAEIRVPDAYLRALVKKAGQGKFDLERLVFGLSRGIAA